MLTKNAADLTEAMVYFEDDPLTEITIPNVKKAAAELPRGQTNNKEWPGIINVTIKEWPSIFGLKAVTGVKPPKQKRFERKRLTE